ncbi:MAG TPA: hypothetical protein PLH94_10470 [Fimbriimonadaceae bacterium]|nr:hypothetical protein [Fimbriimonadaceae bacterium]
MKRVLLMLVVVFAVFGCGVQGTETIVAGPSKEDVASFDTGKEARAWLATPGNGLFEMGNDEGRKWVDRFYAAGAPSVRICDPSKLTEESTGEIAATIGIEFPTGKAERERVLAVVNELEKLADYDLSKDTGQKFVLLNVD